MNARSTANWLTPFESPTMIDFAGYVTTTDFEVEFDPPVSVTVRVTV